MEEPDQDLWGRIRRDDIKAFETLYFRFFNPLSLYASGIIKDKEVAREIVSDVYLKIWQKREQIEIKQGIKSYFFRCVYNACIDYMKTNMSLKQNQTVRITDKMKDFVGLDDEYIFQQLSHPEVEKDVMDAIDKLPPKCKEIFCLSRFEELTYNEISENLNISVNTVKTQISRALDFLHIKLKKYL
jgi:RNA polymerase sigma-70 factor, ECF subfamily